MDGGQAVLDYLGIREHDRAQPRVVSDQVIRGVEPYHHAQVINKMRYGDMLIAASRCSSSRASPLAYIAFAANEANAAHVKLIDASLFRRVRTALTCRSRAQIDAARDALRGLKNIKGTQGRLTLPRAPRRREAPASHLAGLSCDPSVGRLMPPAAFGVSVTSEAGSHTGDLLVAQPGSSPAAGCTAWIIGSTIGRRRLGGAFLREHRATAFLGERRDLVP